MAIKEFDYLKKTVTIQWNFRKKDLLLLATKSIEKIPEAINAKEYYNSHFKKKKPHSWNNQKHLLNNQKP